MPRLTPLQFVALALLAPLAMLGCDIPLPPSGGSAATLPDLSAATVIEGTLADGDGLRAGDKLQDEVATVAVPPGATLAVAMDSEAFDTYLTVEIGGGQALTNDDWQGSRQRSAIVQTNSSGAVVEARILASAYAASGRGAYTVRYLVEEPAPLPEGRPLAGAASGTLTPASAQIPLLSSDAERRADVYTLTLGEGETVSVRMESGAFDTYLKVLRNGVFHARNDDFGGSRSVSQVTLTGPGAFTVLAGAFSASGEGSYTLTAGGRPSTSAPNTAPPQATPAPEATLSAAGEVIEAALTDDDAEVPLTIAEDVRKADAYEVELQAGQTLVVEMESPNFDTYLKVVRGETFVARNDDAGSTRRSEIRHTAASGGTYTVYAGTFSQSGRGAYTIRLSVE